MGAATLALIAAVNAPLALPAAGVIPAPQSIELRSGEFVAEDGVRVVARGSPEARRVADYFLALVQQSHVPLRAAGAAAVIPEVEFRLDPRAAQDDPESYEIEVAAQRVRVAARTGRGLLYGAVTLWQLCSAGPSVRIRAMHIVDAPRLRWRGLMLDSARHFQSPEFIMRYLDCMALHKLNVLGWHLTDDQGWRLQIRKYPRLTDVGAWRVPAGRAAQHDLDPATGQPRRYGGFYSQQEVRRIVAYARARNITIVPEIDVPGHATASIVAYPRLGVLAQAPRQVPADWGVYPNLLNAEESTFRFLEDVLDEVMELFPGEYIHLGGDEAIKDQWQASPRIQQRMRDLKVPNEEALQGYFTRRLGQYLQAHGRRLIGWDEILGAGLPAGAAVMSWRGASGALAAAAAGHDTVLAPEPTLYFDYRQGSSGREPPGRGAKPVTLEEVYRFGPLQDPVLAHTPHLLGLQANVWSEHVRSAQQTEYMTWPRAAALAEVAWSSAAQRDWDSFRARLPLLFERYRRLAVNYSADALESDAPPGPQQRHMSQDLRTCTSKVVLNLEDDAPLSGPRAVFLIDIENPCWLMPQVDLTQPMRLTAAVGQVPFNFQIGADREAIHLETARSAAGELKVYADRCEGKPLAELPLAPAAENDAVSVLPAAQLPVMGGRHDLCLRFAQHGLEPLWALDWLEVAP